MEYRPVAISQTYEAAFPVYILLDVFIYTDVNEGKEEAALRCCKTEHYYPSSPLPRTLRRPGKRLEEDAIAKTKNPGNYRQGPLTPTLPPFNRRRDLSPDSWFSTSIFRSVTSNIYIPIVKIKKHWEGFIRDYTTISFCLFRHKIMQGKELQSLHLYSL